MLNELLFINSNSEIVKNEILKFFSGILLLQDMQKFMTDQRSPTDIHTILTCLPIAWALMLSLEFLNIYDPLIFEFVVSEISYLDRRNESYIKNVQFMDYLKRYEGKY
jgi:hypothetical protein